MRHIIPEGNKLCFEEGDITEDNCEKLILKLMEENKSKPIIGG